MAARDAEAGGAHDFENIHLPAARIPAKELGQRSHGFQARHPGRRVDSAVLGRGPHAKLVKVQVVQAFFGLQPRRLSSVSAEQL